MRMKQAIPVVLGLFVALVAAAIFTRNSSFVQESGVAASERPTPITKGLRPDTPPPVALYWSEADPIPTTTKGGAITKVMVGNIAGNLEREGSQRELRAFYDALRAQGPQAIPVLEAILSSDRPRILKLAALNAMAGMRYMARTLTLLHDQGRSIAKLSEQYRVPEETIRDMMDAGPWRSDLTDLMVDTAWDLVHSDEPDRFRENGLSSLHNLAGESKEAFSLLHEFARKGEQEPAMRLKALHYMSDFTRTDAQPLVDLAVNDNDDLTFRMRAASSYFDSKAANEKLSKEVRVSLLETTKALTLDAYAEPNKRSTAIQLFAQMEGANSHVVLRGILERESEDTARCAALAGLMKAKGLKSSAALIRSISSETNNSRAKLMARRLLTVIPR